MKPLLSLILLLLGAMGAQVPRGGASPETVPPLTQTPDTPSDVKLPNGKLQRDEIAKADYKKNLEDAAELLQLAGELKSDLDKDTAFVVSVKNMKKTEEIEKLARNIRGRLKRY